MQQTADTLPYTIGLEPIGDVWDALLPLAIAHNAEVGAFPELPFDPDRGFFDRAAQAGMLRVLTVRDNADQRLLAYAVYMLMPSMFHQTVVTAHHVALYVVPEARMQGVGKTLIAVADEYLGKIGVRLVFQHTKDGERDHGIILRRLGYQLIDHVYVRRLSP
jgi:GNAT superfamily N-acetyltransferase